MDAQAPCSRRSPCRCHSSRSNARSASISQTDARVAFRHLGDGEVYEEVLRTVPAAALGLMPRPCGFDRGSMIATRSSSLTRSTTRSPHARRSGRTPGSKPPSTRRPRLSRSASMLAPGTRGGRKSRCRACRSRVGCPFSGSDGAAILRNSVVSREVVDAVLNARAEQHASGHARVRTVPDDTAPGRRNRTVKTGGERT